MKTFAVEDLNRLIKQFEFQEKRQIKFWFRKPADRRTQASCARDYFRSLLQPEEFPKGE